MAEWLIPGTIERGLQIFLIDSSGYCVGQDASLANGSASPSYIVESAEVIEANMRDLESKEFKGGGGTRRGLIYQGRTGFNEFRIRLDAHDDSLRALINNNAVKTAINSEWRITTGVVSAAAVLKCGIMASYQVTPVTGSANYWHIIFPKVQALVLDVADSGKQVIDLLVSPFEVSTAPTGESLSTLTGVSKGDHYTLSTEYPLHWIGHKADGVATTGAFTTTYKPINNTVTLNGTKNYMTINGTHTALSAINATTGSADLAAAGTAGDNIVLLHEHNFETV